jgi:hypothetical protein
VLCQLPLLFLAALVHMDSHRVKPQPPLGARGPSEQNRCCRERRQKCGVWPGAESNHRHADFQSSAQDKLSRGNESENPGYNVQYFCEIPAVKVLIPEIAPLNIGRFIRSEALVLHATRRSIQFARHRTRRTAEIEPQSGRRVVARLSQLDSRPLPACGLISVQ